MSKEDYLKLTANGKFKLSKGQFMSYQILGKQAAKVCKAVKHRAGIIR